MKGKTVSVIGAGSCPPEVSARAERLGRLIAESGLDLVCGGLGGVMEAASRGAKAAGGRTLGILPGLDKRAANPFIDSAVVTGLGHMRNFLVIANGDAVIALEGGNGTLSEIGLALKSGKFVVAVGAWSGLPGVTPATGPEEAVDKIKQFLSNAG
ncbi:MAG: TIGR00725 family protein [Desulfovibrionaceae bacterium]|nr:TIGR00725 family protein [Desulfovibrionaceae bacterium]